MRLKEIKLNDFFLPRDDILTDVHKECKNGTVEMNEFDQSF